MLKRVYLNEQPNKNSYSNASVMLLGGFDGLHAGHKTLVEKAKDFRLPIGIMTIVGGKGERGLFTLCEREEIFRRAGVDFVLELPFLEIKDLSPEIFTRQIIEECNPVAFVCGDDFRFGKNACGTPETLKQTGQVRVEVEKLLTVNGEKVSSTKIKAHLSKGEIERANELLGEEFFYILILNGRNALVYHFYLLGDNIYCHYMVILCQKRCYAETYITCTCYCYLHNRFLFR